MRLIGGHDYYDNAIKYGIEKNIVFVREKDKKISSKDFFYPERVLPGFGFSFGKQKFESEYFYNNNYTFSIKSIHVYFCGKKYNGIKVVKQNRNDFSNEEICFWKYNDFKEYVNSTGFSINEHKYGWLNSCVPLEEYFNKTIEKKEVEKLIEKKITIATICTGRNYYNDEKYVWRVDGYDLKEYQFYRVVDPVTAFQEIYMWSDGVLTKNEKNIVVITDDKIKAHKHGFDEWSFRKQGKNSKIKNKL